MKQCKAIACVVDPELVECFGRVIGNNDIVMIISPVNTNINHFLFHILSPYMKKCLCVSRESASYFCYPLMALYGLFSEHSIDHTVAEIGKRKMSIDYARPSCDRLGLTLSSRDLIYF